MSCCMIKETATPVVRNADGQPAKPVAPTRIYRGRRDGQKKIVEVSVSGQSPRELNPRYDLRSHSTIGYDWGCRGLQSAQLALAILADATGSRNIAIAWHHDFQDKVVAEWDFWSWEITAVEIHEWLVRETIAELKDKYMNGHQLAVTTN